MCLYHVTPAHYPTAFRMLHVMGDLVHKCLRFILQLFSESEMK